MINRLGFNNEGAAAVLAAARRAPMRAASSASISAPTATFDRPHRDYARLIETFAAVASYFTVNVFSPNTPGLRDLQQAGALDDLLARVIDAREKCAARRPTPLLSRSRPT